MLIDLNLHCEQPIWCQVGVAIPVLLPHHCLTSSVAKPGATMDELCKLKSAASSSVQCGGGSQRNGVPCMLMQSLAMKLRQYLQSFFYDFNYFLMYAKMFVTLQ